MLKKLEDYQLFLEIDLGSYESDAIMQASYKFTDECYIYINPISENTVGVYFKIKKGDVTELEKIMDRFRNELIDQQTRNVVERSFSSIRDEIVKKAFSSIS